MLYDCNNYQPLSTAIKSCGFSQDKKKVKYRNIALAFDIETTSTMQEGSKVAIMYAWTLSTVSDTWRGRTWGDFETLLGGVCEDCNITRDERLVIYVHNLAFEFQFFRKWFTWDSCFAVSDRTPVKALTTSGVEFKCSYILSGKNLAELGKEVGIPKLVGDLDYDLVRHSQTPLNPSEWDYCVNDTLIVSNYIEGLIQAERGVANIPLTKTGYVRRYCKRRTVKGETAQDSRKKYKKYSDMMKRLTISVDDYKQLKRAFQGGFTHASPLHVNELLTDVASSDLSSSYPAVMIYEKFPMSGATYHGELSQEVAEENFTKYCCVCDIKIEGLVASKMHELYISGSRCSFTSRVTEFNGRLFSAESLITTITDVDYWIIKEYYTWKSIEFFNFRTFQKGYLPTPLVDAILDLYESKTRLKGVVGAEKDYMRSKEMINSVYGMTATDIAKPEVTYREEWETKEPDLPTMIYNYNNNSSRFLFYPWGVWVTAYARRNLFLAISECGDDHVYSDTDSEKCLNYPTHAPFFLRFNEEVKSKLRAACEYHGFQESRVRPVDPKGEEHWLGVFEFEGVSEKFKTLGAKRYLTYTSGQFKVTVAGLPKKQGVQALRELANHSDGDDPQKVFDLFNLGLTIDGTLSGKLTHTYIDDPVELELTDYRGATMFVSEKSSVWLGSSDFSMHLDDTLTSIVDYILGVKHDLIQSI